MDSSLSKVTLVLDQLMQPGTIKYIKSDDEYFECWANDRRIIHENNALFTHDIVEGLIFGARDLEKDCSSARETLSCQERLYEICVRICKEKEYFDLLGLAATRQGAVCEELNKNVTALECYEEAQEASEKCGNSKNYLGATLNAARMSIASHLYYKAMPLLEKAVDLAEELDEEEMFTRACKLLIHVYQKEQNAAGVLRIQSRISDHF